ncbi:MAG: 2-C-methyl-D-erythritol 4-phosphate cytidylyltransferase [Oscillospiraceae bacterium]|nr:2-C-methyl-D-erythritol 4-phosphate cytidylyltransferase [Oscillospiraceae bacterium]
MLFNRKSHPYTTAVIAAAGSSRRFGEDKLELLLCGESVLFRTLSVFEESSLIDEIIISTREEKIADLYSRVREYGFKKIKALVPGGETRQMSVKNAVCAASGETELFCMHDAARPLVTSDVIERVLSACAECGCATAAVPVKNTIKAADKNGFVTATPDRNTLWEVQTPQCFKADVYKAAIESATADCTDDCQLVEAVGGRVKLVMGDYKNIKITTPEDILAAEIFFETGK